MKINHTSNIRIPSSGHGWMRESVCADTFYNHVQTFADIINHWSKQWLDNIDYTQVEQVYHNINKTARRFRNTQNILLFVLMIWFPSPTDKGLTSLMTPGDVWKTQKVNTIENLWLVYKFGRDQHIWGVFFNKENA